MKPSPVVSILLFIGTAALLFGLIGRNWSTASGEGFSVKSGPVWGEICMSKGFDGGGDMECKTHTFLTGEGSWGPARFVGLLFVLTGLAGAITSGIAGFLLLSKPKSVLSLITMILSGTSFLIMLGLILYGLADRGKFNLPEYGFFIYALGAILSVVGAIMGMARGAGATVPMGGPRYGVPGYGPPVYGPPGGAPGYGYGPPGGAPGYGAPQGAPGYPQQGAPGYPQGQPPQGAPGYPPQGAPGYPPQGAPGYSQGQPQQGAPGYPRGYAQGAGDSPQGAQQGGGQQPPPGGAGPGIGQPGAYGHLQGDGPKPGPGHPGAGPLPPTSGVNAVVPQAPAQAGPPHPVCGTPATWVAQYNRWFCSRCNQYL